MKTHRCAVLGAGPIGLEAAVWALTSGRAVTVYERDRVGAHLRGFGHVQLFTPWRLNVSETALAFMGQTLAKVSQDDPERVPTALEFVERYLEPLAEQLGAVVATGQRVTAVSREGVCKSDTPGSAERRRQPFRVVVEDQGGRERCESFDAVFDCTGLLAQPQPLGSGGVPCPGERHASEALVYRLPDPLGADRQDYAGATTLIAGGGHSAATTAVALSELAQQVPRTHLVWVTRAPAADLFPARPDDALPARRRLEETARSLLSQPPAALTVLDGRVIEALETRGGDRPTVTLRRLADGLTEDVEVDRIVCHHGARPDRDLYRELQVHECYATQGPMKLAAMLLGEAGGDCMEQPTAGVELLQNPEPDFYVLGAKSYGRQGAFLMANGYEQVATVFQSLEPALTSVVGGKG